MGQRPREAKWRRVAGLTILALLPLSGTGCLVVAAGAAAGGAAAAGYVYFEGKDSREYPAGVEDTWQATRVALGELGMPIVHADRESDSGALEARTAENDAVNIRVEAQPGRGPGDLPITRVSVRVALLGDHPLSNRILDQIGFHLVPAGAKGPPPLAVGTPPAVLGRPAGTVEAPQWSGSAPPTAPPRPPETRPPPLLPSGPAAPR
jgi:hypothetical protein